MAQRSAETRESTVVEVSEAGESTGVEVEQREAETPEVYDPPIVTPFDPDEIDVITKTPTAELILSRLRSGMLDLAPDFQRKAGIWDEKRKSRLIESLLLRIPLPTFYAAEGKGDKWAVVDGIQRLTALVHFMEPELVGKQPLHLRDLEYLGKSYDNATFKDLPASLQLRLRETEFVLHLIRRGTPEPVKFNIFARINTGGMRLSAQELRHALVDGPIRNRLARMAEDQAFKRATCNSIRDDRMADREMALRYLAFSSFDPQEYSSQDFDRFLTDSMNWHSKLSDGEFAKREDSFRKAMRCAADVYGEHAFRKVWGRNTWRSPINRALFEAVAVGISDLSSAQQKKLVQRKQEAVDAMIEAMNDVEFISSISSGTGDVAKVRKRFGFVKNMLREVLDA